MNKKIILALSLLLCLLFISILLILNYKKDNIIEEIKCIEEDINKFFDIRACYDAYSGNIYVETLSIKNSSLIKRIGISFFDFSAKYFIVNIDREKNVSLFKIEAKRKPLFLDIIFEDLKQQYCINNKSINLEYCSKELSLQDINATINLITQEKISNFIIISDENNKDSLSMEILNKDSIWSSICQSKWKCSVWEECIDGIKKRDCTDINQCRIPTNIPQKVKYCNGECEENWICDWSRCENGYTTPSCIDINNCETEFNIPKKISCNKDCIPNISCTEWGECSIDYNFYTLNTFYKKNTLNGIRYRTCHDHNYCVNNYVETKNCSTSIDIEIKEFTKCGTQYLGVYNLINDSLIASIVKNLNDKKSLEIDFSNNLKSVYCPYCFNGILDGDEIDIDCGGSCKTCEDRNTISSFKENFIEKFVIIIKNFIS